MARRRPKDIGTAAETAVVRALRRLGFPGAERAALAGAADRGDITGTPGIAWEVKGGDAARTATDLTIHRWLEEAEHERVNAGADLGLLVVQRAGVGPARAHRWWAWIWSHHLADLLAPDCPRPEGAPVRPVRLTLEDLCVFLRWAGYGDPVAELERVPTQADTAVA